MIILIYMYIGPIGIAYNFIMVYKLYIHVFHQHVWISMITIILRIYAGRCGKVQSAKITSLNSMDPSPVRILETSCTMYYTCIFHNTGNLSVKTCFSLNHINNISIHNMKWAENATSVSNRVVWISVISVTFKHMNVFD